jgi:hypothetical protein
MAAAAPHEPIVHIGDILPAGLTFPLSGKCRSSKARSVLRSQTSKDLLANAANLGFENNGGQRGAGQCEISLPLAVLVD